MEIRFYPPDPALASLVAHLWTVESETSFVADDLRSILPNGRMKLVFPFRGALLNRPDAGAFQINPENTLWVLGMSDQPWVVDHEGAFGTLAVEFHPGAAYRFFSLGLTSLQNLVVPARDVWGPRAREWEERLAEGTAADKVTFLQTLLRELFHRGSPADTLVDQAVTYLRRRRGLATVNQLSEYLGYSPRYVGRRFKDHVGLSPKTLAEILRFQNQFAFLTRFGGGPVDFDGYYDQAHFTKEFKRFAGLPPGAYARARNEFFNRFQQHTQNP